MPKIEINGVRIHYLLDGEGNKTLVILNGIMMSTSSWNDFVPLYTKRGYRVLRVDFRDQGQSGQSPFPYEITQHVEDLKGLLDYLNISEINLSGISYGGQVAMLFALRYPNMLRTLILANTMTRISNYLKSVGHAWDEAAKLKDGEKFFRIAMPLIYSDVFYNENYQWLLDRQALFGKVLQEEWFERYLRLSSSHGNYDITEEVSKISVPTLLISSDRDYVTPYSEMLNIHQKINSSRLVMIPNSGHACCYEKADEYNIQILGFLSLHSEIVM